jgi:hypothetical protein
MAYAGGCGVYAIVRKNIYDPAKLDRGREQLAKFDELHAQQPGFRGTITIDVGNNSKVLINLWDSREAARAGLTQMRPVAENLLQPLLATESALIGEGNVVEDGVFASLSPRSATVAQSSPTEPADSPTQPIEL